MASFEEFECFVENLLEKRQNHSSGVRDLERWLRRAEEIVTTQPKWKIQVLNIFFALLMITWCMYLEL